MKGLSVDTSIFQLTVNNHSLKEMFPYNITTNNLTSSNMRKPTPIFEHLDREKDTPCFLHALYNATILDQPKLNSDHFPTILHTNLGTLEL